MRQKKPRTTEHSEPELDLFRPMSAGDLPYLIKPLWKKILDYLSPYELLLSRFWSKAFRNLTLQPMLDILFNITRAMPYDIPLSQLDTLLNSYTLSDKKELVRKLGNKACINARSVKFTSTLSSQVPKEVIAYSKILVSLCKYFDFDLITPAKRQLSNLQNMHLFIVSVVIDAIYFYTVTDRVGASRRLKSIREALDKIQARQDLRKQQIKRIILVQAFIALITVNDEKKKRIEMEKLFGFGEELPYEKYRLLLEHLGEIQFYFSTDGSNTGLIDSITKPDLMQVTISDNSSLLSAGSYDCYYRIPVADESLFSLIGYCKQFCGYNLEQFFDGSFQHLIINTERYPLIAEVFRRSFESNDYQSTLLRYFSHPIMKHFRHLEKPSSFINHQVSRRSYFSFFPKRIGFAPVWMRNYLFCPALMPPEMLKILKRLEFAYFPPNLLSKELTFNSLRDNLRLIELHFIFRHLSIYHGNQTINRIIQYGFTNDTIFKLVSLRDVSQNWIDVREVFRFVTEDQLQAYFNSAVWRDMDQLGINDLYFICWCARNLTELTGYYIHNPVLVTMATQELLAHRSERLIFKKWQVRISKKSVTNCFSSIYKAFQVYGKSIPPDELIAYIFDPKKTILPKLISCGPEDISAPFLKKLKSKTKKKVLTRFVKHFQSDFEKIQEVDPERIPFSQYLQSLNVQIQIPVQLQQKMDVSALDHESYENLIFLLISKSQSYPFDRTKFIEEFTSRLTLLEANNLLDKPDYAYILLNEYGMDFLYDERRVLQIFSVATSIESLNRIIMKIRLESLIQFKNECDYVLENRELIIQSLTESPIAVEAVIEFFPQLLDAPRSSKKLKFFDFADRFDGDFDPMHLSEDNLSLQDLSLELFDNAKSLIESQNPG